MMEALSESSRWEAVERGIGMGMVIQRGGRRRWKERGGSAIRSSFWVIETE
jgi:hypothetical protein